MDQQTTFRRVLSTGRERDTSRAESESEQSGISRRQFLKLGLGAMSVLAALELGGAALLFLRGKSEAGQFGGPVTAGSVKEFPPGSVTEFCEDAFFLICAPEGGFLAVYRRCPHLGCTVNWEAESNGFYCPCHGSHFDFYGDYDRPPVPRPLDTFQVEIKDEKVVVDTSRLVQRERFSPSQLTEA